MACEKIETFNGLTQRGQTCKNKGKKSTISRERRKEVRGVMIRKTEKEKLKFQKKKKRKIKQRIKEGTDTVVEGKEKM